MLGGAREGERRERWEVKGVGKEGEVGGKRSWEGGRGGRCREVLGGARRGKGGRGGWCREVQERRGTNSDIHTYICTYVRTYSKFPPSQHAQHSNKSYITLG